MSNRLAEVESLQRVVSDQLYDLMDDSGRAFFDKSEDLTAEDPTCWYRLFSGIQPKTDELLPDSSRVAPHRTLLDFRAKVSPNVTAAFRSKAKVAAIDDVFK